MMTDEEIIVPEYESDTDEYKITDEELRKDFYEAIKLKKSKTPDTQKVQVDTNPKVSTESPTNDPMDKISFLPDDYFPDDIPSDAELYRMKKNNEPTDEPEIEILPPQIETEKSIFLSKKRVPKTSVEFSGINYMKIEEIRKEKTRIKAEISKLCEKLIALDSEKSRLKYGTHILKKK